MAEEIQPSLFVDPEAFDEAMRRFGAAFNEYARQLVALIEPGLTAFGRTCRDFTNVLDAQWPRWREFAANVPDYVPEPPYQGCHCLCAVAHGGLGLCTGEAEPDLFTTGWLDGMRIDIPVCRACCRAKALATT